jgi:hypothetical protein
MHGLQGDLWTGLVVVRIAHMQYFGYDACKKNLCENILKSIFGNKNIVAIQDLKECGICSHLWLQVVMGGFIKLVVSYILLD